MDTKTPIQRACDHFGSISALARAIGVSVPTVHQWITGVRPIPSERCSQVEIATGRAVICEELRPDLVEHWACLRRSAPPAAQSSQEAA